VSVSVFKNVLVLLRKPLSLFFGLLVLFVLINKAVFLSLSEWLCARVLLSFLSIVSVKTTRTKR
jgi:hypothetical protein